MTSEEFQEELERFSIRMMKRYNMVVTADYPGTGQITDTTIRLVYINKSNRKGNK